MRLATIALLSGFVWGGVAFAVLPDAIDTTQDNDKALIIEHKLSLDDEQIDDYEQSEQYKTVKYANETLRKMRGDL